MIDMFPQQILSNMASDINFINSSHDECVVLISRVEK